MEEEKLFITIANRALTPAELIKKHSLNLSHVISENEMRDLKIGEEAEDDDELYRKIAEKEAEGNYRHHENNTYDILDA